MCVTKILAVASATSTFQGLVVIVALSHTSSGQIALVRDFTTLIYREISDDLGCIGPVQNLKFVM